MTAGLMVWQFLVSGGEQSESSQCDPFWRQKDLIGSRIAIKFTINSHESLSQCAPNL
jgi:hypothetical protein